jgi:hypothetical protein
VNHPDVAVVDCHSIELDNGENLRHLGEGNYLELDKHVAGLRPGTWLVTGYLGEYKDQATLRRLTHEEIEAAWRSVAPFVAILEEHLSDLATPESG